MTDCKEFEISKGNRDRPKNLQKQEALMAIILYNKQNFLTLAHALCLL